MRTVIEKSFDPETRLITCDVSDGKNTVEIARFVPESIYTEFEGMEDEGELIANALEKYKASYIAGLKIERLEGLAEPELPEME